VPTFYQITSYIKHKLHEIDEHSLHSPSLFKLYQDCFNRAKEIPEDKGIENIRTRFRSDERSINITDFGAGSKISAENSRTLQSIARGGITTSKYSRLFQELIRNFGCRNIIEFGTSLGINTMYLASSNPDARIWTFEGCMPIAEIAEQTFNDLKYTNIEVIKGNIDHTLSRFLHNSEDIDFVFIDANHTYISTLSYFKQVRPKLSDRSIVIIDDIYWSKEMTRVWNDISYQTPEAACIDIHKCGIIIFDRKMSPDRVKFEF